MSSKKYKQATFILSVLIGRVYNAQTYQVYSSSVINHVEAGESTTQIFDCRYVSKTQIFSNFSYGALTRNKDVFVGELSK